MKYYLALSVLSFYENIYLRFDILFSVSPVCQAPHKSSRADTNPFVVSRTVEAKLDSISLCRFLASLAIASQHGPWFGESPFGSLLDLGFAGLCFLFDSCQRLFGGLWLVLILVDGSSFLVLCWGFVRSTTMFGGSDFALGSFPYWSCLLGSAKLVSHDWFECLIQASLSLFAPARSLDW